MKFTYFNIIICILLYILLFTSSSSRGVVVNGLEDKNKVIELFKPVQLIYPDENHNQLIINETSIALLNSVLDEQLSVLGVVGSFHSGKSFLLNQLLGTTDSFKIGHYVTPQTMGIWMWGCKINFQGTSHNLLLLDTEGFYSSNVSETYDAKIFAITTLLSSHLIYNSVKIIDQSALEYLELLSRRTQLFALKSKIKSTDETNSGGGSNIDENEEGLKNILKFPSLTWVVQDFFQDIGDQTPTQWLHTLLKSHSRDGELDSNSILSIGDIFPSIECHTLFLPSGDRNTLRNLDKAKLVDLNPIYIKELNQLTYSLFGGDGSNFGNNNNKDSTILKKKLTGPSISTLLRLLVQVANGNSFPTVPSIWNGFIKQQQLSALEDSIQLYRDKMSTIHSHSIPLTNEQFQQLEQYSNSYSTNLYKQLLFGLQEAYKPGLSKLNRSLNELHQHYEKENTILIRNYCQYVYSDLIETHFTPKLESIKIPTSSNELNLILNEISKSTIKKYNSKTNQFDNGNGGNGGDMNIISQFKFFLNSLERDIERLVNGKLLKNKNEMELLLNKSIQLIQEIYKSTMNKIELPITISELNKEHDKLSKQLHDKFIKITELAKHENYYPAYQAMNEKNLNQLHQIYIDKNEEKILEKAKQESDSSILDFKKSIATVVLPIEEEQLIKYINEYRIRSISTYKNRCESFRNSNSYSTQLARLESFLEKQIQLKLSENVTQMKWIVMESLDTVRAMMISRVPAFWFRHAYESEAYREAEKRIIDKIKSKTLRDKVIRQFIDTDLKQQSESLFKISSIIGSFVIIIIVSVLASFFIQKNK